MTYCSVKQISHILFITVHCKQMIVLIIKNPRVGNLKIKVYDKNENFFRKTVQAQNYRRRKSTGIIKKRSNRHHLRAAVPSGQPMRASGAGSKKGVTNQIATWVCQVKQNLPIGVFLPGSFCSALKLPAVRADSSFVHPQAALSDIQMCIH